MGYLFLGLALLCGAVKGYCGKKTSGFLTKPTDSVLISLLRMSICIFIGIAAVLVDKEAAAFALPPVPLLISLAAGVTSALFVITWILSVRTGAYMMVDVFLTAGVLIPIISCAFMYGEKITLQQIIGCALLLVAVLIMCSYNNSVKAKITIPALALLVLCGVSNGCTDLLQKIFVKTESGTASIFNFYTYISAAATLAIVYLGIIIAGAIKKKKQPAETSAIASEKLKIGKLLPYIFVMAACLFFYSFFKTIAAQSLDSIILYPIAQVGGMLLSSLMAVIFFKEKMTAKGVLGIIIALVAMLLINIKLPFLS